MSVDLGADAAVLAAPPTYAHQYPRPGLAWWIVFALFCASVFAGLDRYILGLTVDSVKHDLHVTDLQISLLQGLSFSLFYATAGLACGYLSDRTSRKWLLVFGLTVWTLATIAGGLATSFGYLFATRVLVGLGEATLVPVAVSTISDLFPPDKRGKPMGIYFLGQVLAGGLGDIVSGSVMTISSRGGFAHLPLIGGFSSWRLVFLFCGMAGILVVALLAFMPDTPRARSAAGRATSFTAGETLGFLKRHWALFVPFYLAYGLTSTNFYGVNAWQPMFFTRHFGLTPLQVGGMVGGAALIVGPAAILLGGVVTDQAARRGGVRGKFALAIMLCVVMLASCLAPFVPRAGVAVALITATRLAYSMMSIAIIGALQDMAPTSMRGLAASIVGLSNAIIGATGGPVLIALATDKLYHDPALVGYSMSTIGVPALLGAIACFFVCRRALPRVAPGQDQATGLPLS